VNDFTIAKYLRISQDDAVSESMSIPHQRLMLDEFIEELGVPNASVLWLRSGVGLIIVTTKAQACADCTKSLHTVCCFCCHYPLSEYK